MGESRPSVGVVGSVARPRGTGDSARVAVVEDHELLAQTLAFALRGSGVVADVVTASSAAAIIERVAGLRPDVVLLDLHLEGEVGNAVALIEPLRSSGAAVVMLTGVTDRLELAECVEAGACGVISKTVPFEQLLADVERVVRGAGILASGQREAMRAELCADRAARRARREPFARLTTRESEVLQALVDGKSAEEIAADDFVSITTVRTHIHAILQKLGVNSQLGAVAVARQAGWSHEARDHAR